MATLEWHMQSRKFGMTAAELETLQEKSVEVLELLKSNLPEKNGVTKRLEIRERAQHSAQDAGAYPIWLVREFQHTRI